MNPGGLDATMEAAGDGPLPEGDGPALTDGSGDQGGWDVDAGPDAQEAATREGAVKDVVAEDTGPPVCVEGGTENCLNGFDDNCDGKVDCADSQCSAYTCAAPVPDGWVGPALLWTGLSAATAPSCPSGYQDAFDGFAGPTANQPVGCSCTCVAAGQVCTATCTFHPDQTCSNPQCGSSTVTVSPASDGTCTAVPANTCGSGGSLSMGVIPSPTGGNCQPMVTTTGKSAPGWMTAARVCSWVGPVDSPGGCPNGMDQCVLAPPGGFGATFCIYQAGTPACPAAYPNAHVYYAGADDTRGCGPCTCSAPSGGSCAGSVSLYGAAVGGCVGTPGASYALGTPCQSYPGASLDLNPGFVKANYSITGVACSVTAQPVAQGSVTPTGPSTVCCM
jgi:hypothetical protein